MGARRYPDRVAAPHGKCSRHALRSAGLAPPVSAVPVPLLVFVFVFVVVRVLVFVVVRVFVRVRVLVSVLVRVLVFVVVRVFVRVRVRVLVSVVVHVGARRDLQALRRRLQNATGSRVARQHRARFRDVA